MTLEEIRGQENTMESADRVQSAGAALEELLVAAKKQDYLTVGVYESAKIMNVDPDSVAFCVLATDEEYECDFALQIHFTLIQAFCFDNDINVVRVNDIERLADLVSTDETGEPKDAHCILVTVRSRVHPLSLQTVNHACFTPLSGDSLHAAKSLHACLCLSHV
ncbi:Growth arrest and DNA damage-inducible protein GADD45 gamma [Dissostichus eleginoides]|uniref:Growth arrest and DNA damage-inducible protein GADD45 gamma n=1 Tax=Dissostichus eleginoides TaxID=100907 RepID=A0AAD9F933_DISEL|nr:Growth arrest and DNA damage-inducible protein GADD45 gamma [Dissostichus eleginoides]